MPRKKTLQPESHPTLPKQKTLADENQRETVIMFVDIMGASEVSNHKTLAEYAKFVNRFQEIFRKVCEKYIKNWFGPEDEEFIKHIERGDEGLLLIFRPVSDVSGDVDAAVNIALELKREWICDQENATRISEAGLLPINLAIGIHVGKTHLEFMPNKGWNPEGYAINLAKRVESYSRAGRFTHIFVSESAHGHLVSLPDEKLYIFDAPQVFSPKGISRDICVYEVKHHYLPTDWREMSQRSGSSRARTLLDLTDVDIKVLKNGLRINPTNIWLSEEFIRSSMLSEIRSSDNGDSHDLEFKEALVEAQKLASSDQRDAGALFILGLVEGERGDYLEERSRYAEAIQFNMQLAEAHWYTGLSYSYQVFDALDQDLKITYDALSDENKALVDSALNSLNEAKIKRSGSAWISFDYGCELIRWKRSSDEFVRGLLLLEIAVSRLDEVRDEIRTQPYLKADLGHPQIKALLATVN